MMERRGSSGGGCCIAQYTSHHNNPNNTTSSAYPSYYTSYDMSKMDRIMLRFRPIAPKPATNGPATTTSSEDVKVAGKRKRKPNNNAKTTKSNGGKKRKSPSRSPDDHKSDGSSNGEEACQVVTLPLLPETPDLSPRSNNDSNNTHYFHDTAVSQNTPKGSPMWLCFGSSDQDQVAPEVVGSSVIVEGVTDTWVDGNGLGRTDEERRRLLEEDTCPGFISDGWNRVCWTNEAYKRMVTGDDTWRPNGKKKNNKVVVVRLGLRERVDLPAVNLYPAFTCRVRVQYGSHTMTVPCDAWRMNGGGFAWRLDVKAALSLAI